MIKKRRVKVFFTLDSVINESFEKIIDDRLLDKSKLIESFILDFLKRENYL
jgi:hypothetical protein